MPLKSYGVLSGWVVATRQERAMDSPHYQVEVVDDGGTHYRVAVNVESQQFPSELLYYVDTSFHHRVLDALPAPGRAGPPCHRVLAGRTWTSSVPA